ncbi:MAG: hypothetical protein JOZ78_18485 [Chroococcidiopsidaceae cyanobacterium CP_BM_ER_R8_30]|nr:hypothetical protein [Chroococcidiopsidaceae cyanobacterium CP_BM_ER_R8_30]
MPQGSEYKAVCRGLRDITVAKPLVLPIPVGPKPVAGYLERLQQRECFQRYVQPRILVMGLCGSLTPQLAVGSVALYQDCVYECSAGGRVTQVCDQELTNSLHHKLKATHTVAPATSFKLDVNLVTGLTSDRLIWSAAEKGKLGKAYSASVVDMEGFAALKALSPFQIAVAMVRVVSDDCHHNLPNLTPALSPDGSVRSLPLAFRLIRQPHAAAQLIRGALQGLQVLQQVTTCLFQEETLS